MTSAHLGLTSDLNYRDLEAFCAAVKRNSKSPNLLGRSVHLWDTAGSKIRKFAQGCLKLYRTAALRSAAIRGSTPEDYANIKKVETILGRTGMVMGHLSYFNTLWSLKSVMSELRQVAHKIALNPDDFELYDKRNELIERKDRLKKELALSSTFMGLGMGSMLCQTLAMKGVRAAPFAGSIISGVEVMLNLGSGLNKVRKNIIKSKNAHAKLKEQEQKIRDLYNKHQPLFDANLRRSAAVLRNARTIKVLNKPEYPRYEFLTSVIGQASLLVNTASTAILIAGVFGAVAATIAVTPLNVASLALLGIGLAAVVLKWIYVNQASWKIDLRSMILNWKLDNRSAKQKDLQERLAKLEKDRAKFEKKGAKYSKNHIEKQLKRIEEEAKQLEIQKNELRDEKMGEIFQRKFGKIFDIQSVELLKDAALDLRNDSHGKEYLEEFFRLFSHRLNEAHLPNDQPLTLVEIKELLGKISPQNALNLLGENLTPQQATAVMAKDFSFLQSLNEERIKILGNQFISEREAESRKAFLTDFGSLFVSL